MQQDISVTEPFFDAYNRNPHAIKLLFHLIQAGFIPLFGYHIFTFRLISLLFSIGTLYFFYQLASVMGQKKIALLTTLILSLDLQFLYASHLARQEIILLFALVLSGYILMRTIDNHTYLNDLTLGTILGLSIGIHPNSFIIALTIGLAYLYFIHKKKIRFKNLLILIGVVTLFALLFIGISLYMDPQFFINYSQNGKNFGTYDTFFTKWSDLKGFYQAIFMGNSYEYYMPTVKFQLLLFGAVFLLSILYSFKGKNKNLIAQLKPLLVMVFGINLGILIIGRFNVTNILFIFPFMYLMTTILFQSLEQKKQLSWLLLMITVLSTAINIPHYDNRFEDYQKNISQIISADARVLGNLNSEYCFENGQFFAYRNLQYLDDAGINFEDYIRSREINYIIYYDELDFIDKNAPQYNVMYGDLSSIHQEMKNFIDSNCEEVDSFIDSTYGTNLAPLIDQRPWTISIFKVNE
jgi:hypothetical protein